MQTQYRIVIAYPSDVRDAKDRVPVVIDRVNRLLVELASQLGLPASPLFVYSSWDADAYPGLAAGGPQEHLDGILRIPDCDILLGLLGARLGSGTEHEIRSAIASCRNTGRPQVWLYFRRGSEDLRTAELATGYANLLSFRDEVHELALSVEFLNADDFALLLQDHLLRYAFRLFGEANRSSSPGPILCYTAAENVSLRAEGLAERISDVRIDLVRHSRILGARSVLVDVDVQLPANITNRSISSGLCDARLVTSDHPGADPNPIRYVFGRPNALGGLSFDGLRVAFPAGRDDAAVRISGIRVNANICSGGAPISIAVKVDGHPCPTMNVPVQAGLCYPGLRHVTVRVPSGRTRPVKYLICEGANQQLLVRGGVVPEVSFLVEFAENFPRAFTTRNEEETPGLPEGVTNGTRLMVRFSQIPHCVKLFVTTRDVSESGEPSAALRGFGLSTLLGSEAPGTEPPRVAGVAAGFPVAELPIEDQKGVAVWEWLHDRAEQRVAPTRLSFGVVVAAERGQVVPGTGLVAGCLAPISTVTTRSSSAPIPRFADVSSDFKAFLFE